VVKVADGYGRNFLLPKKLAVAATTQNRKWVDQQRVRFLKLEAKEKGEAADLAKLLDGVSVSLVRKAGDKGNLFGSVTSMDIAEKLLAQGYHVDRRKINLASPIKALGEYSVSVKLHREVTSTIKVHVEPDEETKAKLNAAAEAQAREAAHFEQRQKEKAEATAAAEAAEAPAAEEAAAEPETEKE
jgi:large subunit ribosomal protein L9